MPAEQTIPETPWQPDLTRHQRRHHQLCEEQTEIGFPWGADKEVRSCTLGSIRAGEGGGQWGLETCDLEADQTALWCAHTELAAHTMQLYFPRSLGWTNGLLHARTCASVHASSLHTHTKSKSHYCNMIQSAIMHAVLEAERPWHVMGKQREHAICSAQRRRRRKRGHCTFSPKLFTKVRTLLVNQLQCYETMSTRETYSCLPPVRRNKSIKIWKTSHTNSAAAFQQHLINKRNRCYLLPLKAGVMNPVIFSPHTHRLR